ncbi:predicted protein [Lichtheimia corymbifera JMRC:FSU:9682]|uniref:Uncharacterized protein n=1 Tax=Lichtheimia corymbifera JMRC:FSU:9682 TaxID=1263082 RepID=A0A068SGH0_9FUNG|nr:predicted protein [Lichtheimia corymbifera JMRC:FSU:9682]CDH61431.1 predicted protein [Lichtheimia corymbifera JMRC:FSU:9682]
MYIVGSTKQDRLINDLCNETAAAHTGSDGYMVVCKHQEMVLGIPQGKVIILGFVTVKCTDERNGMAQTLFQRYYHDHSSTSRDGVYCLKGEGHCVLAETMFDSWCDFGLKMHPLIDIGEQRICSTLCRAIRYSTWRDGGYLHGNVAGPTASGCQSQLGRGSYGSPETGVLMPRSSSRLEGSACASFLGCTLFLLLLHPDGLFGSKIWMMVE